MLPCLLLSAALCAGQEPEQPGRERPTAASAPKPETSKEPAKAPSPPPPDRFLLMRALQGTWRGDALDGNRLRVTGWAELAYTASSGRAVNLPLGFNYLANQPVLQQNWLRF